MSELTGPNLQAAGERIETLLEASSTGGAIQRERAEELVGLLTDLYGAGLARVLEILEKQGHLDPPTLSALTNDELVSSLLLVHGLHPSAVEQRVEAALESVRPYLGSHGGDVELLGVDADGVVQLRLLGSCDGCPSSAVTLQLAVEGAVEEAAPEITGINVEMPIGDQASHGLISIDSLRSRIAAPGSDAPGDVEWIDLPELTAMEQGELSGFALGSFSVFACALDAARFVYMDECAHCNGSFAGASLAGTGERVAVVCPSCSTAYDVRRAGANVAGGAEHLTPFPVLESTAGWRVAVPLAVPA